MSSERSVAVPDEASRFPFLSDAGRAMVRWLAEQPHAPRFRNTSGHRLGADDLAAAAEWQARHLEEAFAWRPQEAPPEWVHDLLEHCYRDVPFFRARGAVPSEWCHVPTCGRAELAHDVAAFVPDAVPAEQLIHFSTSGATGERLLVPSHPLVAVRYLTFHRRALERFGIEPRAGRGEVGVVLLGFQQNCFTYVSVTPLLGESGLAKLNLHPDDWNAPADRAAYLNALRPEVIAGDPLSFAELLRLDGLECRPRALLCTAMALLPALRAELASRFDCPVLDLYSMNEAGPIAVHDAQRDGHVLLQPRMYVEIVDGAGRAVPPGTRGEIVLTGGFNFCLPLLRYRTGDWAALEEREGEAVLVGLEGRPPVRFRRASGEWLNNIEVTHAFARARLPLPRWGLHQRADATLELRVPEDWCGDARPMTVLRELFGAETRIEVAALPRAGVKLVQYTSALGEGGPA